MNVRTAGAVLALLVLAGCSSSSTQLVPMPDQSVRLQDPGRTRIYLYRAGTFAPQDQLHITLTGNAKDGRSAADLELGAIGGDGYLCFELPPGTFQLHMELVRSLEQNRRGNDYGTVKGGQVAYFEIVFISGQGRRPQLREVSEREGKAAIASRTAPTVKVSPQ